MAQPAKQNIVKRALYAATAMLGAAGGMTGLAAPAQAQAQGYSAATTQRLINAEHNVLRATYESRVAQCNTRLYSGSRSRIGESFARTAEARACRADAEADFYTNMARFLKRYDIPNEQYVQRAFNARSVAYRLELDADKQQCNARFFRNIDRAANSRSSSRGDGFFDRLERNSQKINRYGYAGSQSQVCQARAEATYARNMATLERSIQTYTVRGR